MGQLLAYFYGQEEEPPPVTDRVTCKARALNILRYQYRGLLTVLATIWIIIFAFLTMKSFDVKQRTLVAIWKIMFVFILLKPMDYPVTGMMPIVFMPLFAILSTKEVAQCYFSDSLALMLVGGMMSMITNNSGLDKRICLAVLSAGSTSKFSAAWFTFKAGFAAFANAVLGHRLISCVTLYDILSSPTESLAIRDYINMAVQTSSTIGSLIPLHGSLTVLASRAMYYEFDGKKTDFNYSYYALYSIPFSVLLFTANILYYISLVKRFGEHTEQDMSSLENSIKKASDDQPEPTNHQRMAVILISLYFATCFFRGSSQKVFNEKASDATIAVLFVFILHVLPRNLEFCKVVTAKTEADLPERKPSSAILWWRYVDKHTPYAYMFLIGGGVALVKAVLELKLDITATIPKYAVFIIGPLLSLGIGHTAVTIMLQPMLSNMKLVDALVVGVGTSLGFTLPFEYSPAYYCHHNGKTPINLMMRIGIGSSVVCGVMLALFALAIDAVILT